jgi:transglutaminase-like putative cysteine protease
MASKPSQLRDPISIGLILICIWLPAALLQSTGWAADLDQVELLAVIGVVLGLLIGRSIFPAVVNHIFFTLFTLIIPLWLFTARMTPDGEWLPRLAVIVQRANLAIVQSISGRSVQDPLIFIIFCSYFFWLTGYYAGYGYSHRWNPWQGLLAAAGIFGVVDFYTGSPAGSLWGGAALVLCLFLLAARLFWIGQKKEWDKNGVLVEKEADDSVLRLAGITAILLVLFCWNLQTIIRAFTPGTPENVKVSEIWKTVQSGMQNNFASLQSTTSLTGTYTAGMQLGNQAPLQQDPAFQVRILSGPTAPGRYYWRVRVYEDYLDGRWQIKRTQNFASKALESGAVNRLTGYSMVKAQYIWQSADGTIIPYAGRFSGLDIPYHLESSDVSASVPGDGMLYPQKALIPNSLFILESAVFSGNPDVLRAIPYSVPPQIAENYLQIPSTVPARVKELGASIAVGDTVFDKINAVNAYLRKGYEYKSQISTIPSGKDPIDWFLFESRQGFCNYFASAEVLLLRSAGIPARLAVGYSQGEKTDFGFQVRLNNGHAWPEVYFSDLGWIPFEPTPIQPDLPYASGSNTNSQNNTNDLTSEERRGGIQPESSQPTETLQDDSPSEPPVPGWIYGLGLVAVVILAGIGIWLMYFRKNSKKLPRLSLIILNWLQAHNISVPDWLSWWNWYTGLSDLAVQYYWIEKMALFTGLVKSMPGTPSELLSSLVRQIPELRSTAARFRYGLYYELYSEDKNYDLQECKAAGAALHKQIRSYFFHRIFRPI